MRLRFVALIVPALIVASPAAAGFTFDLLWGGTSQTVSGAAGEVLTLELYVSTHEGDPAVTSYNFSLLWDPSELRMVEGSLNNAGAAGQTNWYVGSAGESFLDNEVGELLAGFGSGTIAIPLDGIEYEEGAVYIGSLQFEVVTPHSDAEEDVIACFDCGSMETTGDGWTYKVSPSLVALGNNDDVVVNGAILINPEPSTAALLGLGLITLATARRRGRQPY